MAFADRLISWQRSHGRRNLPWQGTRDPYPVWLSEVMLQQTQVAAVIPYYGRFLKKYPNVKSLAEASEDEVLRLWSGLGYYARGRNLHAAAREIAQSGFPSSREEIEKLPGVGRSTAAAIAAFAFGERAAILDGNVKRVLARHFRVEGEKKLWALAESLLPAKKGIEAYTQALMDLGATVCVRKNPRCEACPVARSCVARKKGLIDQLPAPRIRQALPLRKARWWVYLKGNKVLLKRRPSKGLWGGLLTFPEVELKGCTIESRTKLPVVEHGFTHFRLRAQPFLCQVEKLKPPAGCRWVSLDRAADGAVPTPVRKLLIGVRHRYSA